MKKLLSILILILLTNLVTAQVYKTVNISAAGTLSGLLTANEKNSITNFTVTGNIDARDFKTMRDLIPNLTDIDLSNAMIIAYTGTQGTDPTLGTTSGTYLANAIPQHAFDIGSPYVGNEKLKNVILPFSTIAIGTKAFVSCRTLVSISVPNSVNSIESSAFDNCRALESFNFPSSITSIANQAFSDTGLRNIIIPNSVTSIGSQSFFSCDSLTMIRLPNSLSYIASLAFESCGKLDSVYVYNSTPLALTYSPFDQPDIAHCTLFVPYKAKSKYAADKVWKQFSTIIEDNSGFNLSSNSVSIASESGSKDTVSILSNTNWTVSSDQLWLNASPVTGSNDNTIILTADVNTLFPTRIATVTISAKDKATQTIIVTQDGCLKTINNIAGSLKYTLSKSEKASITRLRITGTIDARDFFCLRDSMPNLLSLDMKDASILADPASIGSKNGIPNNAFYNSNTGNAIPKLKKIILPDNVTTIGQYAFFNCMTLQSVVLPNSLTTIDHFAFSNCSLLNEVILPESLITIGIEAFLSCQSLKDIFIPNSVTSIGDRVFYNCSSLVHATLPNSISLTPRSCFENCTVLDSVSIPSSISYINISTFAYCSGLTNIVIPNSVTWIDARAFEHCYSLKKIDIPNSVTKLGAYAFYFCDSIVSVTIPKSVTSIDNSIFELCSGLKSIYNYGTTPLLIYPSSPVFSFVSKTECILYVPSGTKSAYQAAFEWKDFTNIVEMTTALPALTGVGISVYPNPINESFQIKGIKSANTVSLSDLNGKIIFTKMIIGNETVSVSTLQKGLYILKIRTSEGVIERKLAKE